MRLHRIRAIVLLHGYEARHSVDRITDTIFWPVFDVVLWGFMTVALAKGGGVLGSAGSLLAGTILWSVFRNFQRDIAIGFLAEVWSRNLAGLFATPLTIAEYFVGLVIVNALKAFAGLVVAGLVAWACFGFDIFPSLPLLGPYVVELLLFAFAVGMLVTGLIFRLTSRVQSLTWTVTGALLPLSCVYYPVRALPEALRPLALALPTTRAFEGMRLALATGRIVPDLWIGLSLCAVYLVVAISAFRTLFESARHRGLLVKLG